MRRGGTRSGRRSGCRWGVRIGCKDGVARRCLGYSRRVELLRALAALAEPPSAALRPIADALELGPLPPAAIHADLFDFQLYPFASVYLNADGMLGGEARDRIAGFWRALGASPPAEPDHLTTLLGGLASLLDEAPAVCDDRAETATTRAWRAFFAEHIESWLPAWLSSLERLCAADDRRAFFRCWGHLLGRTLAELEARASVPGGLPLHLRAAPALADPRQDGADAFLQGLLAPAVSGIILLRDDLARGARTLELGLRHGERRFVLRALLGQRATATFAWLAQEAQRQAASLRDRGPADRHWRKRAAATSHLLRALACAA